MSCAVMIPVHNALPKLKECLASIPEGVCLHIYDDASDEETQEYVCSLREVYLVRNERPRGYAHHINTFALWCLRHGKRVAVVANSDVVFGPCALGRLVAAGSLWSRWGGHGEPPKTLFAGPSLSYAKSGQGEDPEVMAIDPKGDIPAQLGELERRRKERDPVISVTVNGSCFAFSTMAWAVLGPFDERFGRGSAEEEEWMRRVTALSGAYGVHVPSACVYHYGHASFGAVKDLDTKALWRKNRDEMLAKEAGRRQNVADVGHPRVWPEYMP